MLLAFPIGFPELLIILVIVVLIFGAGKLPQLGDALGRSIKNFKKATNAEDEIDVTPRQDGLPSSDSQTAQRTKQNDSTKV